MYFLPFWLVFVCFASGDLQCCCVRLSDVVSQESIEKSAEEVHQLVQEEGLNCLINNAGINVVADFHTVTAEKMIENFHTNAVAPLMITKVMVLHELCSSCRIGCSTSATLLQLLYLYSVSRSRTTEWLIFWMLQTKTKRWPWWTEVTQTP